MPQKTMFQLTGLRIVSLVLLLSAWVLPVWADSVPPPPQVPVRGYILMDFQSGQVLAESNSNEHLEPASITKVMTGYVLYKALQGGKIHLDDQVTISENAWRTGGSRMYVELGSKVSVENLLLGMDVQSGNDATVALAEYLAGTESAFVAMMNQEAATVGLKDSHFMNSSGLPDPKHYMTAHDIAVLVQALIKNFPKDYARYSVREFTYNKIAQQNRNRLLWQDESVDGVKTGFTDTAGYCLVSSAKRGDMRLIGVVLGAKVEKDRIDASKALLTYGFNFYEARKLYEGNKPLTEARVWKGAVNQLPLGLLEDLAVTVPKGKAQAVSTTMQVDTAIEAPVPKGKPFGRITATLDGKTLVDVPLVALQDVAEAGFFGRLWDRILYAFHWLFS